MNVAKAEVADAGCSVTVLRKKGGGGERGSKKTQNLLGLLGLTWVCGKDLAQTLFSI